MIFQIDETNLTILGLYITDSDNHKVKKSTFQVPSMSSA